MYTIPATLTLLVGLNPLVTGMNLEFSMVIWNIRFPFNNESLSAQLPVKKLEPSMSFFFLLILRGGEFQSRSSPSIFRKT